MENYLDLRRQSSGEGCDYRPELLVNNELAASAVAEFSDEYSADNFCWRTGRRNSNEYDDNNSISSVYDEFESVYRQEFSLSTAKSVEIDFDIANENGRQCVSNTMMSNCPAVGDDLLPLVMRLYKIAEECEKQLKLISDDSKKDAIRTIPSNCINHSTQRNSVTSNDQRLKPTILVTASDDASKSFAVDTGFTDGVGSVDRDTGSDVSERTDSIADSNNNTIPRKCRPTSVAASLVITRPFVDRASAVDNPHRRRICRASPSSATSPAVFVVDLRHLRRTVSEEHRTKQQRKVQKTKRFDACVSLLGHLAKPEPPLLLRSRSCFATLGGSCLPVQKGSGQGPGSGERTWYEGLRCDDAQ